MGGIDSSIVNFCHCTLCPVKSDGSLNDPAPGLKKLHENTPLFFFLLKVNSYVGCSKMCAYTNPMHSKGSVKRNEIKEASVY